eukprot:Em0001g3276a
MRFKTDVVTFGVVCKVHTDKDSRVIKAWEENGLMYYAWRHRHKLKVDHALLHALFDHTLQVRVWNTKSKLSPRARFDRPKAFRLPIPDPVQGEPQNTDSRPAKFPVVSHDQPRQSRVNPTQSRSSAIGSSLALTSTAGSSMVVPGVEPSQVMSGMGSSLAVPGMETSLVVVEEVGGGTPQAKPSNIMAGFTPVSPYALQALPTTTITLTKAEAAEDARVEREGLAMLPLPLASLYGHSPTLTSTLPQGRVDLRDMRVTLEVEESLMSDQQRRDLNPLCITVCQARGIPPPPPSRATPLTTSEAIDESWEPIYVQYHLMGTTYRTSGQERGGANAVSWNETKGQEGHAPSCPVPIREGERRPPHGTQTYCRDKRGASSPYPYGVAKLDLSELLLGQRLIEVRLPILNCPNTCHQGDVPLGDYLGCHTDLKIRVELAQPILPNIAHPLLGGCPFSRLVYVVSGAGQLGIVRNLLDTVNEINGRALGLTGLSRDLLNAALSTCKLTSDQITLPDCDVITGFQVCDGECHVVALEGLANGGLRDVWEGAGASQQPRALLRLSDLKRAREMADIVRNDLLPSADEIVLLSANFSVPFPSQQQHLNEVSSVGSAPMEVSGGRPATPGPGDRSRQRLPWEPLELTNPGYELVLAGRRKSAMATDFVQRNITQCQMLSVQDMKHEERKGRSRSQSEGNSIEQAYNYSIQALNSTEMGKARLRARLSRDLKHRYTYSRDFLGATAAPFDLREVEKAERMMSENQWVTPAGFVYPGHTTSLTSNAHPKAPHSSRVEELREAFQDLWLRATTQKPTADRNHDFDLYTRAPAHFGPAPPVSIHLAGDRRKEELGEKEREEEERWRARVVVDHLDFRVHRKPVSVELKERGPGASNQLDRLCGLLKDPPYKHSLLGGEGLGPRSCLGSVTRPPGCEEDAPRGGYQPGPLLSRSLKLDKNVVPIRVSRGPVTRAHHRGDVKSQSKQSVPELKSMDLLSVS